MIYCVAAIKSASIRIHHRHHDFAVIAFRLGTYNGVSDTLQVVTLRISDAKYIGDNLTMINSSAYILRLSRPWQHVPRSLLEALYFMTRQEGRRRALRDDLRVDVKK